MGLSGRAVIAVEVSDLELRDLTASQLAHLCRRLADHVASDEATTYTDDGLYLAACRLTQALSEKVDAAAYIRGIDRGSPKHVRPKRRTWRWFSR